MTSDLMDDLAKAKRVSPHERINILKDPLGGRLRKHFLLPDFVNIMKGRVKSDADPISPDEQVTVTGECFLTFYNVLFLLKVLTMEIERFCVPELLFRPSDIGISQAGVAETVWQGLKELPMVCLTHSSNGFAHSVSFHTLAGRSIPCCSPHPPHRWKCEVPGLQRAL